MDFRRVLFRSYSNRRHLLYNRSALPAELTRRGSCRGYRQPRVLEPRCPVCHPVPVALTDRDRAILDFERTWWTELGPKDAAIRERFDLSGTRYYQLLTELLDDAEAMDYDPLLVRRLRRVRERRRRARVEGRPMRSAEHTSELQSLMRNS